MASALAKHLVTRARAGAAAPPLSAAHHHLLSLGVAVDDATAWGSFIDEGIRALDISGSSEVAVFGDL